jgi:DNA-binding GntR family transcriptional regulator
MSSPATTGESPIFTIQRFAAPLRQRVVEEIRLAIVSGRFASGSRLVERLLCEQMQVSRTVVREALRQLESEKLIEMVPNVGSIVRSLTLREARSLYEVRASLESLAARDCAERASDDVIEQLAGVLESITAADPAGLDEMLALKDAFTSVIVSGSANEVAGVMLTSIHARVSRLRAITLGSPGRMTTTIAELSKIYEAIARHDGEAAGEASRAHIENAAAIALGFLND